METPGYTDEYAIYVQLENGGYVHHPGCQGHCDYARDDDGDGVHEVHGNTIEGGWSRRRSWLRPQRGVSQEKLPWYLGFVEFVHNARVRGEGLLKLLWAVLLP